MATNLPPQPIQTIANNSNNKLPVIWSSYQLAIQNAIDNFAPSNAQYVVTQSNSQLSNEFVLANLTTGFLKVTTASGNLTSHPTLDPTDLSPTGVFANTYNVNGNNFITVNSSGQITLANDVIVTAAPSGSAGGDLTGTYPNPTIASVQGTAVSGTTGSGNIVFSTSPTFVTPVLGTPTSGTLTNCTSIPVANATGTLAVGNGGTGTGTAGITAFNNITGYTAVGSTGTTSTELVFSTSPTLITPVLGVASATSINFGGTSLSNYTEGTWTPNGNGVTLTNNATAYYTRIGRLVHCSFDISFPATANASVAQITGLPFTVGSATGVSIAYQTTATAYTLSANAGGTKLIFYTLGGSQPTNATLSTQRFIGGVTFSV